jgi:hypothetical protein
MTGKSYVNTHEVFYLDFNLLERFIDGIRVFTEASLKIIIQKSGFTQAFDSRATFAMEKLSLCDMIAVPRTLFPQSRTSEEMKTMAGLLPTEDAEGILQKLRDVGLCWPSSA